MKILDRRGYRGPNVYALYPVVRLTVDLEELDERFSDQLPGFDERLLAAIPRLAEHGCCYGRPGGFVDRLRSGTLMGHVLEHIAIAIQNQAIGEPRLSFGKTRSTGNPGEYHVIYAVDDVEDGIAVADVALRCLKLCLSDERGELDVAEAIDGYVARVRDRALGPSTAALVAAARARGIPFRRLDDLSLIELGHGKHARRLRATITENTGCIAAESASDKQLAARLMTEAGLPVPRSEVVDSAEEAIAASRRLGTPVVIKPRGGNHGRGVRTDVRTAGEVRAAFEAARRAGDRVIVQSQIDGADHRLLVVGGRLVAAARREAAAVIGDGRSTIGELIEHVNRDPRRGDGHGSVLSRVVVDDEVRHVLRAQGLDEGSVVPAGLRVPLTATANLSTGGTAVDVTEMVHPDNARVAERAARALRLDVAGIDFIIDDIATSWREQPSGICEINAAPGLRMHLAPSAGEPRDVAVPIIEMLFPADRSWHVPIAALTGTNGKTTTARMLAHIQERAGRRVGLATTDGVYVDGELLAEGDLTGPAGARMVLGDPRVDSAVLEVARGGILRRGVGFDRCDVGAVLNVSNDHLGSEGVETVEEMAYVKRVIVEIAERAAVLSADDPNVAAMASSCRRANEIIWVSRDPGSELIRAHLDAGNRAVVLDRDLGGSELIAIGDGRRQRPLVRTVNIPATLNGQARFNIDNAMFAAAMALGGGVPIDAIAAGLASFEPSFARTPGRLNVYDGHPFRVILDYCHNPAAFRALGELVSSLPVSGRRILVAGLPGDRRDRELAAASREAARHWDRFILRDDDDRRGRARLEVPRLVAAALVDAGVDAAAIEISPTDEAGATRLGLAAARPGDLLVILPVDLETAWQAIVEHRSEPAGEPEGLAVARHR